MSKYWNETVQNIEPYVPGEQPRDKKYVKLNTNENPYPPCPNAIEAMKNAVNSDLKLYPDPTCKELVETIADYYDLQPNEVFVGNGSDEILAFTFMAFFSRNKKLLFPDISYSFYEVYANLFNLDYDLVKLDEEFSIPLEEMKNKNASVIFPNPNAPTGKFVEVGEIKKLLESNIDNIVVIDEAYVDFGGESMVKYIKDYPNLLVIQTLSKSRSLAGIRGGFALGQKHLIEGLNRIKNSMNSYTLDRVALAGFKAAFSDEEYFNKTRKKIMYTREDTVKKLKELGFKVIDSKSNFVFASHKTVKGQYIYDELKKKGVLVRHFNKDRIDDYLRITIGTPEEMAILIEKLNDIL